MVLLTELLPQSSSTSSTNHHNHRYDVFLSFRGVDTRNSFTDHLYNALLDAGIRTFLDDEEIETGDQLKPELESAIKSSRASIIVLSENYASSTWCLDELVLILDQMTNWKQIVIPIFYHVEPTDVRKQQSSFADAMAKHKRRMEEETDAEKKTQLAQKIELWNKALTEVSNLKGCDPKDRKESELITEVVTDIHRRLGVLLSNTLPLLFGMDGYIEFISSWLTDGSRHTADILTIVGMGGIGKTSLAKYVFQLHSGKFHKSSFVEGVNTRCNESFNGLLDLQKQLHGDISKKYPLRVSDVSMYTSMIENALAHKMVFLVLDDVDSLDQLDALLGNKGLHQGSKIIITTKDASLTERCALFNPQVQFKHTMVELYGLCDYASRKLFYIHAFKSHTPEKDYTEVSEELVRYCNGHPLALQVLGKLLHKRDVTYWREILKGLKKEPHSVIKKVLQMSIDALSSNDMELFKHISCFFVGKDKDVTEIILDACDINTQSGVTNLIDRCLLSITWNKLTMHQLVQDMGRYLVLQESPDKPWECSRLWCHEESFKVLDQKKDTKNVIGFALDMRMLEKEQLSESLQLKTDALSKMDNLKLLQLNYVKMNGSYKNISKELRWLCMHGGHFKAIPSELPMENLVVLDMSYSFIESFDMSYRISQRFVSKLKQLVGSCSKDKHLLGSLMILDLSFCEQLSSIGGFFELPKLESLILKNCISLIEVCESIDQCVELVHIDLSYCCKLKKLPSSMGKLKKVETLLLDGCNSRESHIETMPSDLMLAAVSLPCSLKTLSLANVNLSNESFPMDWSCLSMLEQLCLDENPIVSMPNCVRTLPRLQKLSMSFCELCTTIDHPPRTLTELIIRVEMPITRPYKCLLRQFKFDPKMSLLRFKHNYFFIARSSYEIYGLIKIQDILDVEEDVLHSLGWANLEFVKKRRLRTLYGTPDDDQCQMYYEFGIFSTFYEGDSMPNWISWRTKGTSLSFTIPSSPKKLRGLNFYCVEKHAYMFYRLPCITISNITKNHTWIYHHYNNRFKMFHLKGLSMLSHWMFGPNEMKAGDHITITVAMESDNAEHRDEEQVTRECGIGLVYDEDGKIEEEEDVLGYYKLWNHIIGGDLSPFELTTGEYVLQQQQYIEYWGLPIAVSPSKADWRINALIDACGDDLGNLRFVGVPGQQNQQQPVPLMLQQQMVPH